MWAQLMRRTLLSLILRLLFLNPVAAGNCSGDGQQLLQQLQHQADLMQDTGTLLDLYIRIQGLDVSGLKEHCQERPGVFPREDVLQKLSRRDFLQTLNTELGRVLHRLAILQQDLPKVLELEVAKMYMHGVRNNIHCMAQLLRGSPKTDEPTLANQGTSPPPTPASDAFQRKLEGCRFLRGYHRFMHSVGRVFRKWRETPSRRSRRHSPRRVLQKEVHRMQPSMRGKRLVPRGQLPR
ncbi:oncostatin-M [Pteronotus mesoamericanus]|uniref:oncostatin-M n=1 Tax=Pteronotus mesoamericanus TaxID=1884717 RepID=UPI0023ED022A|nr:oncostatin-M [Pteronotus parnellii mesoamericanus]